MEGCHLVDGGRCGRETWRRRGYQTFLFVWSEWFVDPFIDRVVVRLWRGFVVRLCDRLGVRLFEHLLFVALE
jgi:hypothetical protein